jgi:hypothetical protein
LHSWDFDQPLTGIFTHTARKTENVEFNKYFSTFTPDSDITTEQEVARLISPAMQERLLELKKQYNSFSLLLQDDVAFFIFSGVLLKAKYSDLFKSSNLDDRDINDFEEMFKKIFNVMGDMLRFLD